MLPLGHCQEQPDKYCQWSLEASTLERWWRDGPAILVWRLRRIHNIPRGTWPLRHKTQKSFTQYLILTILTKWDMNYPIKQCSQKTFGCLENMRIHFWLLSQVLISMYVFYWSASYFRNLDVYFMYFCLTRLQKLSQLFDYEFLRAYMLIALYLVCLWWYSQLSSSAFDWAPLNTTWHLQLHSLCFAVMMCVCLSSLIIPCLVKGKLWLCLYTQACPGIRRAASNSFTVLKQGCAGRLPYWVQKCKE